MADLITCFVNGKLQNKFVELSAAMEEFLRATQQILESIYADTLIFEAKKVGNLKPDEVSNSLRKDLEGAVKGLHIYNRIFGRVDNQLALMSSNFTLRAFLEENGFPKDRIQEFQYELSEYWKITYGNMFDEWHEIRNKLDELRKVLEAEIALLNRIPNTLYIEALRENIEVRRIFLHERAVFYEVMRLYETSNNFILAKTAARLEVQISKTKAQLQAHLRIIRKDMKQDMGNANTRTRKAIVILCYFLGAYLVVQKAKKAAIVYGVRKILANIFSHPHVALDRKSESLTNLPEF